MRQHTNGSNTFYMSNMDVWISLRWISDSTMMLGHHFHSTTLNSQILGQLGQCNGIRVHPHAFDSAYQWLKHFVYNILYISMKQSEVDISLKHDIMALISLHKWPWVPKSWTTLASVTVWVHPHALQQYASGSNTLDMSNMDVWNGLMWISASNMTLWHQFHSTSDPDFRINGANLANVQ